MPINNITQTISAIPEAAHRGVDVQTVFVIKQEDFQDHLQGITVTELNTLKDQLNSRIGEINSTTTTMSGYADTASAGASTATTKAGEASTSAGEALAYRNQAETYKNNASSSATKASQWADNNYNVEVETGKYSAKHWATVAQSASGEDTKGSAIASATTTIIGTAGLGDYIHITGTTTINSFGTAANAGVKRTLIFDGALTITNGANLICVGGVNIITVPNTIVSVIAETTTQWRVEYVIHPSVSFAELGYLDGVTSAIQTQLNSKFTTATATESTQGLIELATTAESQAGTDNSRAITPLGLFNSLKGSNQSLLTNGYQKLHGGLIIQWGLATCGADLSTTVNLPISFPNSFLNVRGGNKASAIVGNGVNSVHCNPINNSSFTLVNDAFTTSVGTDCYWFAIGY